MRAHYFLLLLISLLLTSCNSQNKAQTIAPKTFSEKIKATPNAQILDVRTLEEFEAQHLENAV